jgi:hypothetical protein
MVPSEAMPVNVLWSIRTLRVQALLPYHQKRGLLLPLNLKPETRCSFVLLPLQPPFSPMIPDPVTVQPPTVAQIKVVALALEKVMPLVHE